MLLIDDFVQSAGQDMRKLLAFADRLFRGRANHSGRHRMTADTSLRPVSLASGMITANGEDVPRGHSLRARLVLPQFRAGDVDQQRLTIAQSKAAAERLAEAMASYVNWLATQDKRQFPKQLAVLCSEARRDIKADHNRTPENVADLMLGIESFLKFAVEVGAITTDEQEQHADAAWEALCSGGDDEALRSVKRTRLTVSSRCCRRRSSPAPRVR